MLRRTLQLVATLVALGGLGAGAYLAALDTSMFALRTLVVVGGSPALDARVQKALAPELGRSLLRVSGAAVDATAATLPQVVSLRFVRAFPHTLRVYVTPERPVLLVRRGVRGFVVSARGRVMSETTSFARSPLPRMWVAKSTPLAVGETLRRSDGLLGAAAAAALPGRAFPGGVRSVATTGEDVTLLTPSGFQVRLGDIGELRLKLAIASRIVAYVGAPIRSDAYLDVSVPERPVLGSQSALTAQAATPAASTPGGSAAPTGTSTTAAASGTSTASGISTSTQATGAAQSGASQGAPAPPSAGAAPAEPSTQTATPGQSGAAGGGQPPANTQVATTG